MYPNLVYSIFTHPPDFARVGSERRGFYFLDSPEAPEIFFLSGRLGVAIIYEFSIAYSLFQVVLGERILQMMVLERVIRSALKSSDFNSKEMVAKEEIVTTKANMSNIQGQI